MLKEPYRSQAIEASENAVRISRIEKLYPSLSEALINDFIWDDTPQEWLCWHKIHKSIALGETTYLADDEHECKHYGVMTTQPDEECYKATTDTTDGWVKCSDRLPDTTNGEKVLLYRVTNDSQRLTSMVVHDTSLVKHCNPTETWWRELPEPPTE